MKKNQETGSRRALDRRAENRKPDPPCPTCRASADQVEATARTGHFVFYRCLKCGRVWQEDVPPARGRMRGNR